jgi:hypothetical protein
MAKIDVPAAIKAMTGFAGSAYNARNEERDRQAYLDQWNKTHALNLAAERRAQERFAQEKERMQFEMDVEKARWARETEDNKIQDQIVADLTARYGMHPEKLRAMNAILMDELDVAYKKTRNKEGALSLQERQRFADSARKTNELFAQIAGVSPEEAQARGMAWDYASGQRGEQQAAREHEKWKMGEVAGILEDFPHKPVPKEAWDTKTAITNARQQYESLQRDQEVPEEIRRRYGDSPEQIAAERALGLGGPDQTGGGSKELTDMLKGLKNLFYEENETSEEGGTWTNPAAENLFNQAAAALTVTGEQALAGMGFPPPSSEPPPAPDTTKDTQTSKTKDTGGYDPETKTWETPLYTPDNSDAAAFGTWLATKYPNFGRSFGSFGHGFQITPTESQLRRINEHQKAVEEYRKKQEAERRKKFGVGRYNYGK